MDLSSIFAAGSQSPFNPFNMAGTGLGLLSTRIKSPAEKQAQNLANRQADRQLALSAAINEKGRPIMDAEVNRLNQILSSNLGISEVERVAQQRQANRALSTGTTGASSLGAGLRGTGANVQAAIDASADIAARNAMMERNNRLRIQQQLANAEGRAEMFNEIQPFQELQTELQANIGAQQQNQYLAALMESGRQAQLLEGIQGAFSNFGQSQQNLTSDLIGSDLSMFTKSSSVPDTQALDSMQFTPQGNINWNATPNYNFLPRQ